MCKWLDFWTWRCSCLVVSIIVTTISFVFGPLHTLLYICGYKTELDDYMTTEQHYAIFLIFLISLSWYLCVSHTFLLEASCFNSLILLNIYICFTLTQLVLTLLFTLYNLLYCSIIDIKCMDHRPGRTGDDIGGALGTLFLYFIYAAIFAIILSLTYNYRIVLEDFWLYNLLLEPSPENGALSKFFDILIHLTAKKRHN